MRTSRGGLAFLLALVSSPGCSDEIFQGTTRTTVDVNGTGDLFFDATQSDIADSLDSCEFTPLPDELARNQRMNEYVSQDWQPVVYHPIFERDPSCATHTEYKDPARVPHSIVVTRARYDEVDGRDLAQLMNAGTLVSFNGQPETHAYLREEQIGLTGGAVAFYRNETMFRLSWISRDTRGDGYMVIDIEQRFSGWNERELVNTALALMQEGYESSMRALLGE